VILQQGTNADALFADLNIRQLSYEGRVQIIRETIKDIAYRELLYQMLEDEQRRPTASDLLNNPIIKFF
jgi:hypothetical protein